MPPPLPRKLGPYRDTMRRLVTEANGWIRHDDATMRFKKVVLPTNPRSAGIVALADKVLEMLVAAGEIEKRQEGPVRTYRAKR